MSKKWKEKPKNKAKQKNLEERGRQGTGQKKGETDTDLVFSLLASNFHIISHLDMQLLKLTK